MTSTDRVTSVSADATIDVGPAYATWSTGWLIGAIATLPMLAIVGVERGADLTVGQLTAVLITTWSFVLVALVIGSRRFGSRDFRRDFAVAFEPIDAVAVPIGIVTQLVVLQLLYAPLRAIWPDAFSTEDVEERARTLVESANGAWMIVLVVLLVAGAPLVEELAYRGLLQRSAARAIGPALALVSTSALFAVIHFVPVEYPGLFVAGLVFGGCLWWTGRVGTAIVAHASFNAAGVITALAA